MKICHIEEDTLHELPESPKTIAREPVTPSRVIPVPRTETIAEQAADREQTAEQEQLKEKEQPEEPAVQERPAPVTELPPLPVERQVHRPLFRSAEYPVDIPATVPQPVLLEESDIKLIGQIKKLNGVVAISVFNNERNILLMGDVDIEPLLKIARNMLATTRKISPLVKWGSFVHMTLKSPEGNIIIAPFMMSASSPPVRSISGISAGFSATCN